MKKDMIIKVVGIVLTILLSLVFAYNYGYAREDVFLIFYVTLVLIIGMNQYVVRKFPKYRFLYGAILMIALVFIPKYDVTIDHDYCDEPALVKASEYGIPYYESFESNVINDGSVHIMYTYDNSSIDYWDFNEEMLDVILFNEGSGLAEIQSIAYFDGELYISGRNLYENLEGSNRTYALYKYNFDTKDLILLFDSVEYNHVYSIGNELYVNVSNLTRMDEYNALLGDVDVHVIPFEEDEELVRKVSSYGEYEVVQKRYSILLYKNGELVQELVPPQGEYSEKRFIYFYEDTIRITAPKVNDEIFINVYDLDGNFSHKDYRFEIPNGESYVLLTEHYTVFNYASDWDQLVVRDSLLMDQDGEYLCAYGHNGSMLEKPRVLYIDNELYINQDGFLYELEEIDYTVPIVHNFPNMIVLHYVVSAGLVVLAVNRKTII